MTGYQIQTADRNNAYADDNKQVFDTLEEARGWVEAVLESFNCESNEDEEPMTASDLHIAYYENGVHRGDYLAEEL